MRRHVVVAVSVLAILGGPAARATSGDARFVDGVVAAVDGVLVTASDIAVARALGLFGLQPTAGSLDAVQVSRYVDGRLLVREATRLGLRTTGPEKDEAWAAVADRVGGGLALDEWLSAADVDPAWARRLVDDDLLARRFVDLRFRALAFVSEDEVSAALGAGGDEPTARDAVRGRLEEETTRRRLAEWLAEARAQSIVGALGAENGSAPDPLPAPGWRR